MLVTLNTGKGWLVTAAARVNRLSVADKYSNANMLNSKGKDRGPSPLNAEATI